MSLFLKATLGLDGSGFELGIKRAQSAAQKFATQTREGINSKLSGFLSAAFVEEAIRKTVDYASTINDLSERLGVSTDAIQQWEYAVTQAGGKAEDVASFFEKLAANREKALGGDNGSLKAFKTLGVNPADLQNKRVEDIGLQIGNAIKGGDAQALIGSLKEVGGKGAGALVAAMKEGLSEQFSNAPLIKTEDIIKLDAMGDDFATLGKKLMAGFTPFITFLGKALLYIFDEVQKKVAGTAAFAGAFSQGGFSATDMMNPFDAYKRISRGLDARKEAIAQIDKEQKERDDKVKAQIDAAKGRGGEKVTIPTTDKKADKIYSYPESKTPNVSANINSLQQIGAKAGFNPMQTAIEKNTIAVNKATDAWGKTYTMTHKDYQGSNSLPPPGSHDMDRIGAKDPQY